MIGIKEDDIYTTSFKTAYALYEFVMALFGLTNAPTTFMYLMNSVLHPHFNKFVIVFIDYILIYSNNEKEDVKYLVAVLILIRQHQLYAKIRNCSLFQTKVHYLGHAFSKEDIVVDPRKIRGIMEWLGLKNVDEVRSLMLL